MILPDRRASLLALGPRLRMTGAVRLTASPSSRSASLCRAAGLRRMMPALLDQDVDLPPVRLTVLRDGSHRGTLVTADTDADEVTRLMIGRSLDRTQNVVVAELGDVGLEVRGRSFGRLFEDVRFQVRAGEVLGLHGPVGAGRSDIAEALFGLHAPSAGSILIDGREVAITSPQGRSASATCGCPKTAGNRASSLA